MDEMKDYKETLLLIQKDAEMFLELKYGTPELELRMKSAALLKIGLFAQNALQRFAPEVEEAVSKSRGFAQ